MAEGGVAGVFEGVAGVMGVDEGAEEPADPSMALGAGHAPARAPSSGQGVGDGFTDKRTPSVALISAVLSPVCPLQVW